MTTFVGSVQSVWRYPVKSMQGEQIAQTAIGERGVLGDRAYAVLDRETGHVASAKHPRKWETLFQCRAAYAVPPQPGAPLPPVVITLPDGATICSDDPDAEQILSRVLGRDVALITVAPAVLTREANRSPLDDAGQETIKEEPMALAAPAGTFFDHAPVHVLSTATLRRLADLFPPARFDVRRFRPNIVVAPPNDEGGFVENEWLGRMLKIGSNVCLKMIDPTPRCVVTTLGQGDLPRELDVLRTIAVRTAAASVTLAPGVVLPAVVGVYGSVRHAGTICEGDGVLLE